METGGYSEPGHHYPDQRGAYPQVPDNWIPQPPYYEQVSAPTGGLDASVLKSYLSDLYHRLAKMGTRGYLLLLILMLIIVVAVMAFLLDNGMLCSLHGVQQEDNPFWPSLN